MESNRQVRDGNSQAGDPASRIEQALAALRRRPGHGPGRSHREPGDRAAGPFPGNPLPGTTFPGGPFGTGAFGRNPFGWGTRGPVGADETGADAASSSPNGDRGRGTHGGPPWMHGGQHWNHGDAGPGGFARFRALEALADGPRTITELAEVIGVDQPRASRLVAFGVKAGLVRKAQDPADARRAIVELTDAGRQAISAARDRRRSSLERGLASFTPEEAEQFAAYLERFVAGWGASDSV